MKNENRLGSICLQTYHKLCDGENKQAKQKQSGNTKLSVTEIIALIPAP